MRERNVEFEIARNGRSIVHHTLVLLSHLIASLAPCLNCSLTLPRRERRILAATAAGVVVWTVAFKSPPSPPLGTEVDVPSEPVAITGSATGSQKAPLVVMVFSDFECPYCGEFARETWPLLANEYVRPGAVQFVFRHLPLSRHKRAERTAQAAECAGQQGKFWPMHDQVFAHQLDLSDTALIRHAVAVGADREPFDQCMQRASPPEISADASLAKRLGIQSTPAFLIGRRESGNRMRVDSVILGANPVGTFRDKISPLLNDTSRQQPQR